MDLRHEMVGIGCTGHGVVVDFGRNDTRLVGVRVGVGNCPVSRLDHIRSRRVGIAIDGEHSLGPVLGKVVEHSSHVLEAVADYGSHVSGRTAGHDSLVLDTVVDCTTGAENGRLDRSMAQEHDFQDIHKDCLDLDLAVILALSQQDLDMDVADPACSRLAETGPHCKKRWQT